jgi:3',5'-cyclic AMP phosphodiesterase CpdA
VARPFLLLQLSDPHIGATWGFGDPVEGLAAAIDTVLDMEQRPDAIVVTGDLADSAAGEEYRVVAELLARLEAPFFVLPGNHDDRDALRRAFDVPGTDGSPIQYAADLGPLRLVVVDSTRPGEAPGELDADRLEWLDAALAAEPERATIVAMHHPPLVMGSVAWDEIGLPDADRQALATVLQRHPQVRRVVAGHVHQTVLAEVGGCVAMAVPSTYVQSRLTFGSDELGLESGPPGFAVHALTDGALGSHVQPVPPR